MAGQCLAQLNTQCDHGAGTVPVLERTQGPTPGLWGQSQGMSTKAAAAAAAQEPPCHEEFAQGNREKSFFIPQPFRDVPTNPLQSRTNGVPAAAGKSFQTLIFKAWGQIFSH